jgi:hypothetical protein
MRSTTALAAGLATLALATNTLAQDPPAPTPTPAGDGALPVAYAQRPLTLPEMTISPEMNVQVSHFEVGGSGFFGGAINVFFLEVGGSFGIMDDLMVEARPLGFVAGDVDTDYSRFQIGATYRFLKEPLEMGARFRFQIDNGGNLYLNPGLPMRIHAGDAVRIDTGVEFTGFLPTGGGDPSALIAGVHTDFLRPSGFFLLPSVEAGIPFDIAFNIVDEVFLGLSTGYGIGDLSEPADASFMPLGFFVGGTVPGEKGPLVDIGGSFGFPYFLIGSNDENPTTELWAVGVTARGFIQL